MTRRPLSPEEAALWARVMASARPIDPRRPVAAPVDPAPGKSVPKPAVALPPAVIPTRRIGIPPKLPGTTLDRSWDRKLARGLVAPESMVDLHGHTLASAHSNLDAGLDRAIARGDRVLLLVTGKPPRPEAERPYARGAIRAAVGDWLAGSRHADRIAAVRGAHPRHGGAGALYIVLRRLRD
ncbi:Smr/MutS family protein [Sphingomonas japonica]|uniref:DNA-nicking Smr family endonuclease n=1 Tax=Sphingomonas japonica TaxID=511662 RepID=A0ABX0U2E6_9SPHN|nr:Smr/MutS family protein [Sphingomonas japonica]NIJ24690.1 DNA-nicking Smr family endonuclease [Sphingomonas japonica]